MGLHKTSPADVMPVQPGFEECDSFQLTNPCSTGVKPNGVDLVSGKALAAGESRKNAGNTGG